jgi:outer membrane receptor for ferrienterochelin and colicins
MKKVFAQIKVLLMVGCMAPFVAMAQGTDTLHFQQLEEVIITATRNERTMGSLPMPVTLVQMPMIKTMGSVRLNDVLTEQTGLVVVPQINGQGNGIQIQGLNPDYTLILVDGEPIIGRYTGSLELSRLTVGNIKQIEIVKGPSSSLYGSDALAGVINIITEKPITNTGKFSMRYGTNNTLDLNAIVGLVGNKWNASVFANRYSTDGYDLSPQNYGKTVSPFLNYTLGSRIEYKLNSQTILSIGGRYFGEKQDYSFDVYNKGNSIRTYGAGKIADWNMNTTLSHRISNRFKLTGRFYVTNYETNSYFKLEKNDSLTKTDNYMQWFKRFELVGDYQFAPNHITTLGTGLIDESVVTNRYYGLTERTLQTKYLFVQHEWSPISSLIVIGGMRYDNNSKFGDQISPKLSVQYEVNSKLVFKSSFGVGFKTPDFRQLYYNFYNAAGGGYNLWGSEIANERINEFQKLGLIQSYSFDLSTIGTLEPERSLSINVGAKAKLSPFLSWDVNLFRNNIDNLIDYLPIALTTSRETIYSFRNIKKVFTQGIETDLGCQLGSNFSTSIGYQLLYAKDQTVVDKVDRGDEYWRDPVTLQTQRLKPNEYFGLYNRSRHTGNFKVFYKNAKSGWEGSVRVIYRGKFGVGDVQGNIQGEIIPASDRNDNLILDGYDNFVPGYALVNLSVAKSIQRLRFQLGVDNLLDYTNPIFIPNLPGRLIYGSVSFSLFEKSKNQ